MEVTASATDPVREELERVLASPGFSRSERSGGFLRYVVQQRLQGKTDQIKEVVIGVEVFGRKPDYDPRSDPVVRIEAAKLRTRLAEYYAGAGAGNPIRIEIPKGAYIPQWEPRRKTWTLTTRRRIALAIAFPLCLVIVGLATWRAIRPREPRSLVVLPFLNFSPEAENEYFSDGLTEEIIQSLSVVEGLEVISRTSSFALKGARLDTREIGARLNAALVLEGSFRKQGERVRVTAQLIRAADGRHIWSNSYDREMRDIIAVQQDIASSIASALQLKLGTGQRHYTDNLEAYQLYVQGRHLLEGRGRRLGEGLHLFEQAIVLDANYALAYAGAADALLRMDMDHQLPHEQAQQRAKAAAEKAAQIDPMLSEAHAALASVAVREYAWQKAERTFRYAIKLNPNNALARLELGDRVLVAQERFDEGLGEIRRSLALDPLSSLTAVRLTWALLLAGAYKEAEDQARKTIALEPRPEGYIFLGQALYWQGKLPEALAVLHEAERRQENGSSGGWLACADVRGGLRDEALQILRDNLPGGRRRFVPNRRLLTIYACLGDKEHSFEYLEKMYTEREPLLPLYLLYPEFAWMRSDPRFNALRLRIGLSPMSAGK